MDLRSIGYIYELKVRPQPPHCLRRRRKRLVTKNHRMTGNLLVEGDNAEDGVVGQGAHVLLAANLGVEQFAEDRNAKPQEQPKDQPDAKIPQDVR